MECSLCKTEMPSYESNNPEPLMMNVEENRVCRDCNYFVTASRMYFRGLHPEGMKPMLGAITSVLSTAFLLKRVTEQMSMRIQPTTDFAKEEEE